MPHCRKCGVNCLDLKVRNAHEEICNEENVKKKRRRRAAWTSSSSTTTTTTTPSTSHLMSDHGYAMNISCVLPKVNSDHSYSATDNQNISPQGVSSSNNFSDNFSDHTYTQHSPVKYLCGHCGQRFKYIKKRELHESKCVKIKSFCCHKCGEKCVNQKELYNHRRKHKIEEKETTLQTPPWENESRPPPWDSLPEEEAKNFEEVYNLHRDIILQCDRIGSVVGIYNIPLDNTFTIETLMDKISSIYAYSEHTFRINLTFSTILQNTLTKDFRYFQGYRNNSLLENPPVISKSSDLLKLKETLETKDIAHHLMMQRENTKYKPVLITNVNIWTYNTKYVLGHEPVVLPSYITYNKTIMCFSKYNRNNRLRYYTDNLCAFRNVCYYFNPLLLEENYVAFEVKTLQLFEQWVTYMRSTRKEIIDRKSFLGVDISDIPLLEECFHVNVELYEKLDKETVVPVYKSENKYKSTIQMNVYNHHLSLILDFPAYAKKFKCEICNKLFDRRYSFIRHQERCNNSTTLKFQGGFYKGQPTIFEELDLVGIHAREEDRFYPWFIVYDFEAVLEKINHSISTVTHLTSKHVPISVAVCSNYGEYRTPKCIMNSNYGELIEKWFTLLHEIHSKISSEARIKWNYLTEELEELLCLWEHDEDSLTEVIHLEENNIRTPTLQETGVEVDGLTTLPPSTHECEAYSKKEMYTLLKKLEEKLEKYINQVPVIGFNSSKYDILLCRTEFTKNMGLYVSENEKQTYVIKKGETYPSISNENFIFLDLLNFLAPGFSYSQFLKAYNVEEKKLFFPYEYISSIEVLNETALPPIGEAWYSTLKNKSVLDDNICSEKENYEFVKKQWREKKMKTLWDLLSWYNMGDVAPFVTGVECFVEFYYKRGIDVFKIAISTPGIARKMLMESARKENVYFSVIDSGNKDLFFKIRNNLTGGPSIIFNRHLKVDHTLIRGIKNNFCKTIVGWDAASLYLYCMSLDQPSGIFIRRKQENNFRPEVRDRYYSAYHWMDWLITFQNRKIHHLMNTGREKRIGPFLVDGYDSESDVCYEYYGCFFHGHKSCVLASTLCEKERNKRYQRTMKRESYIRSHCNEIVVMWECEFMILKRIDNNIKSIIEHSRPNFYRKKKGTVTFEDIVEGIQNETLYGFIECDISTVTEGDVSKQQWEYFSEMSPLFCTTQIPYDHFGKHMQRFVEEQGLSKKERTLLVGGMSAQKILLHSKLLKWYLNHGMHISHIYEVIEFTPTNCFKEFTSTITYARREAETDPTKQIIGQTFKIIGNSAYGSMLMDKLKHNEIKYVKGVEEAEKMINSKRFKKLSTLDEEEELYEVELRKKVLHMNIPLQIGFTILQFAKLRMLEMYYDFIDYFFERNHFELGEMDTDSLYFGFTKENMNEMLKEGKREEFTDLLYNHCYETEIKPEEGKFFIPRQCCQKHETWDSKVPGLFKKEYSGKELISLNSKCYIGATKETHVKPSTKSIVQLMATKLKNKICKIKGRTITKQLLLGKTHKVGYISYKVKVSCKGISKKNLKSPLYTFRNVLSQKKPCGGVNKGFIKKNNYIYSYNQFRQGLTYFYIKREVLEDGVHTKPLLLTLTPVVRNMN